MRNEGQRAISREQIAQLKAVADLEKIHSMHTRGTSSMYCSVLHTTYIIIEAEKYSKSFIFMFYNGQNYILGLEIITVT